MARGTVKMKRPLPRAFLDGGPANSKSLAQEREDEQHYFWFQTKSSGKVVKTMNQSHLRNRLWLEHASGEARAGASQAGPNSTSSSPRDAAPCSRSNY